MAKRRDADHHSYLKSRIKELMTYQQEEQMRGKKSPDDITLL